MEIINLTEHPINIYQDDIVTQSYPTSGTVARLKEQRISSGFIDDVRLTKKIYGEVEGLPSPSPNKIYIVSSQIVESLRGQRSDIIAPDILVRNKDGQVIGCKQFWYA